MKNPIKSLKSSWNRAKVNHPFKTVNGALFASGGTAATAALLLLPVDGGISAAVISAATGFMALPTNGILAEQDEMHDHNKFKNVTHNGDEYVVSVAQARKYNQLQKEIDLLSTKFSDAATERHRKKFQKKAQRLVNYQEDILDSVTVRNAHDVGEKPQIQLSYKHRRPGN